MTQLPPEHHDKAAHNRPAQRAPRDHTGLDWHSLLAGEAPATTPVAPLVPAASVGSSDPRVAGPTADPRAPQSAPHRNDPFAQTAPAGADGGQPLTRRERRELEEREAARQAGLEAEPAVPAEEPARSSRAARRATADSGYEHFDDHDGHEAPEKPKRRGAWGCLVGLLIVAGLGVGAYLFLQGPITAVVERFQPAADYQGSGTGEVVFMIHDGDTGSDIATNLVGEGVTASYDAFYDELLAERPEPEFHPGAYQLASEMSGRAALDALLDPANKLENTFVIPEGTATADALPSIAEGTGTPIEELQAAAAESPQSYGLPAEATSLEGFLFPATYTLDPGLDARGILQTLVDRQFQALDEAGVAPADRWKTIVLAALVQREAGLRDDYYKVSRVFQNRLDPAQWESGLLQSDATVAYGTGNTHRVSTTDAEREDAGNPFNTYVHPGLPVGPISNPGDLAIDAAVHPADGPWLYFVTWNLDSGETIFSTTQEEHDAAVEQWLSWMDEHPEYK